MNDWIIQARAAWAGLSDRERVLLAATAACAVVVLLFFAVVSPLLALVDRTSSGVGTAQQQLELMQRLTSEHAEVNARVSAVERKIRAKGQNSNILTLLESLASTSGVKIESMEERQAQANERYRETKVEVELKSVTLTQAVNYLHNIEQSAQLLSIKTLRVKSRSDESSLLDVTFAVSSFEPL